MRGHIHKRVRNTRDGKETTRWYVVVDVGLDAGGRRRQKWHGGFATRREAEVARAKIVNDLHTGSYVAPDRIIARADRPPMRFVSLGSRFRLRLPSHPASRRRCCPWLVVSAI